jgi:hypothetical protein
MRNDLPLFLQRIQQERWWPLDLRRLLTNALSVIHHQEEKLQAHEQEGEEGNAGNRRTIPPTMHHPSRFIASKITSASKLGPRPLLTTLINS